MNLYDREHNLVMARSLNNVQDIDYAEKLSVLGKDRSDSKCDAWEYDKCIADIKSAYVDFAISEIIKTAVENHAVIAIEEFNDGFKDKMSALDNQVFRRFDARLENRLSDYFTGDVPRGCPGSMSDPLQLASNDPHRKGHMQNGILFRISPAYTLADPGTGFVNLFKLPKGKNAEKRAEFLSRCDSIRWDKKLSLFVAEFDYKNFDLKLQKESDRAGLKKTRWTVYIGKPRTDYDNVSKTYIYNAAPWKDLVEALDKKGLLDKDLAKEDLGPVLTNKLFTLFEKSIRQQAVRSCDGNPHGYFTSPANAEDSGATTVQVRTENLARKLWYTLDTVDTKESPTIGWLNHLTA
jgi:CRISPR-associated protein Cpf1